MGLAETERPRRDADQVTFAERYELLGLDPAAVDERSPAAAEVRDLPAMLVVQQAGVKARNFLRVGWQLDLAAFMTPQRQPAVARFDRDILQGRPGQPDQPTRRRHRW